MCKTVKLITWLFLFLKGVIKLKVITEKGGVKARSVNDKAIEHSIAKKTELSKRNEKELTSRTERTVHHADRNAPKTDKKEMQINRTIPNKRSGRAVSSVTANNASTVSERSVTEEKHTVNPSVKSGTPSSSVTERKPPNTEKPSVNSTQDKSAKETTSEKTLQGKTQTGLKTAKQAPDKAPTGTRPPKRFVLSKNMPKNKRYKVLKNGALDKETLQKKKQRVIYKQQENKRLRKIKQSKLKKAEHKSSTAPVKPPSRKTHIIKRLRNKKFKLKRIKKQRIKLSRKQAAELLRLAASRTKKTVSGIGKAAGVVGKSAEILAKPIGTIRGQVTSQSLKTDKTEDSGTEAVKLGLQSYDYLERGVKTSVNAAKDIKERGTRTIKNTVKRVDKIGSFAKQRKLKKQMKRGVNGGTRKLTKKVTKNAAKATVKTAKKAAEAAKTAAKAAQKAAQATAKAVVGAVSRLISFIASTMPYSLIIIGAILIILILCLAMSEIIGGAGGSVAGGGAWLVDDEQEQTPEEIYEGYKEFIEQAKDVMQTQAKDALKNTVTGFCSSDTTEPRKIIQYIDKNNNRTFYPALGADSSINPLIDLFGTDDYADYMSLLFVLMTREKQQADGVSDGEIYDFDFEREDFEEFMKTVNENSCRWGDTFVIKTAITTSPVACPGQNCKRKTISGCKCASYTDEEGKVHLYCKGHPYCPVNHTKMTVQLYTVKDYYNKDYPEIYNFTDNEKARYEASKAIIQGLLDYWE